MNKTILQLCASTAAGVSFALSLGAQSLPTSSHERAVTVVLKEKFTRDGLGAVVRRETGATGRDIIAIRRSELSPETLVHALEVIAQSRRLHGADPSSTITVNLVRGARGRTLTQSEKAEARATISELMGRGPEQVRGVGLAAHVTLPGSRVPRQKGAPNSGG